MQRRFLIHAAVWTLLAVMLAGGCSSPQPMMKPAAPSFINLDTVKAGAFDTGKMWTFDFPPVEYFAQTYSFNPDAQWFEHARLSALRVPGCTASFVTGDGLVMTNHHCARGALDAVNREGENLPDDGFYAATLEEERRIPNYYADQLVLIEDVTDEVVKAFESGATDEERVRMRQSAIVEVEKRYAEKTGLTCNVITFYNGGRFSLYGYKRYNDVRLVFAPETAVAYFGGDPDNFTYPRYDLDVTFYRVYGDDGTPLKTDKFFRWSAAGAQEDEGVFVLGNPGRTNRLLTVSQLEFFRDHGYPFLFRALDNLVRIYSDFLERHPDLKLKYQTRLFSFSNSQKLYDGRLKGLRDPVMLAKKRDFERTFKNSVAAKPGLRTQYAPIWDEVERLQAEKAALFGEGNAFNFRGAGRSLLLTVASDLVEYANQMKLPEDQRQQRFRGDALTQFKARMYPADLHMELERAVLEFHLTWMRDALAGKNEHFNLLLRGRTPAAAADEMTGGTTLSSKEAVSTLLNGSPDAILASSDPFISFIVRTQDRASVVRQQLAEIQAREAARVQMLGKALYDVYGTSIPPDATFTLRIADGVVKGYPYNGTIAPVHTTFYGMYDRYYSFGKKDPWALPKRWQSPPPSFDMSTPFNFVSTNDIIGGNSGSPIVNKNLEVVGLIFDGNIESLPNDIIYSGDIERAVSVHSAGIVEALKSIYQADRLVKEIKAGKISP
jgi:hypothetical protein